MMSAHTAESTRKGSESTEPRGQEFDSADRWLNLGTLSEQCQLQPSLIAARAILSAAYPEENDASIDVLDSNEPSGILSIRLHLDKEQLIGDIHGEIQRELGQCVDRSSGGTSTGTQEALGRKSSLPKALIASGLDDRVPRLLERGFVLAIACQTCRIALL